MSQGRSFLLFLGTLAGLFLAHLLTYPSTEPFFNNDETRHVMTGYFFRDVLLDQPFGHLRSYAINYYLQYPALGLFIWPPFFHGLEGIAMALFGPSFLVSQILIGLFAILSCAYLFGLVAQTNGSITAALSVLLFGFSPLVMEYTQHVMLEIPTLACGLMACYHFRRYLDTSRGLHLLLCGMATAITALTRFDGVLLGPVFGLWLIGERRWDVLKRKSVWFALGSILILVVPYYVFALIQTGGSQLEAMSGGTNDSASSRSIAERLLYYPFCIPIQMGWYVVPSIILGLSLCVIQRKRASQLPYLALILGTWLTFTFLGELDARHTIYWIPAFAALASQALVSIHQWLGKLWISGPVILTVVVGTMAMGLQSPHYYVRGYQAAAEYVVSHSRERPVCLFDGMFNGNFIYQMRRLDPDRQRWILRGDKLFYTVKSEPGGGYREWVKTEQDVLDLIYRYDPEYLVIEKPYARFNLEGPRLVRAALEHHPDRFEKVKVIPVENNYGDFEGIELWIYRNKIRNPKPSTNLSVNMLSLGRTIEAALPGSKP